MLLIYSNLQSSQSGIVGAGNSTIAAVVSVGAGTVLVPITGSGNSTLDPVLSVGAGYTDEALARTTGGAGADKTKTRRKLKKLKKRAANIVAALPPVIAEVGPDTVAAELSPGELAQVVKAFLGHTQASAASGQPSNVVEFATFIGLVLDEKRKLLEAQAAAARAEEARLAAIVEEARRRQQEEDDLVTILLLAA